MGGAQAKNILDNTINNALSILNQTTQTCETSLSQNQSINIQNCTNVNISGVNFNQIGSVNISCAQSGSSSSDIATTLKNDFQQAATAINQALSLNPSSTTAENITRLMENLSTSIQNVYTNNCIPSAVQNQSIVASCPVNGGTATINAVNFNQTNNDIINCTQQSTSVSSIKSQVENIISQTASATVEPIISFGALIVILVVLVIVFFQTTGPAIKIIIVVIAIVLIYLAFAYFFSIFPFSKSSTTN